MEPKSIFSPEEKEIAAILAAKCEKNAADDLYEKVNRVRRVKELNARLDMLRSRDGSPKHPERLTELNSIAISYIRLNEFDKALDILIEIYPLQCKLSGESHPDSMAILNNMAYALLGLDKLEQSFDAFKRLFTLQIAANHPDAGESLRVIQLIGAVISSRQQN